ITRVFIGGQDQGISGPVSCNTTTTSNHTTTTTIDIGAQPNIVMASFIGPNPLRVKSVVLNVNGKTLRYPSTSANSPAAVTQTGNSYTIIGAANTQPPSAPQAFEIDATCS
ncbi:MAG TPA: lipoprotein LpqH, partial [Mycobacterium sp.]|nr:lipoprotein LpqH [Mycobacterium sp.]